MSLEETLIRLRVSQLEDELAESQENLAEAEADRDTARYELDGLNRAIDKAIEALELLREVPLQDLIDSINSIIEVLAD